MLRIDVTCGSRKLTFRTNNNGEYLFVGDGCTSQISTESGFNSLKRVKKWIREWLAIHYETYPPTPLPRCRYNPISEFKP